MWITADNGMLVNTNHLASIGVETVEFYSDKPPSHPYLVKGRTPDSTIGMGYVLARFVEKTNAEQFVANLLPLLNREPI